MEQGRVGEHAVEPAGGQVEPQEILLPDLASAERSRHLREARGAFESDRDMAATGEVP